MKREFILGYGDNTKLIADWLQNVMDNDKSERIFKKITVTYEDDTNDEDLFEFEADVE